MSELDLAEIQDVIGYRFSDPSVLAEAFTHSSYVNEHGGASNERLEFLGDCVLNFSVGLKLFESDGSGEGDLSARRAALVSRGPLSRIVDNLGLIKYLRVGAGVNTSAFSDKARSDLFEAIVGAVYLDGGLGAVNAVLDATFYGAVEPEHDYKSELQQLAAKRGEKPEYDTQPSAGGFTATVKVFGAEFTGFGRTKHAAEIAAAKCALK